MRRERGVSATWEGRQCGAGGRHCCVRGASAPWEAASLRRESGVSTTRESPRRGIGALSLSTHSILSLSRYIVGLVVLLSTVSRNVVSLQIRLKQNENFVRREPVESRGRHARSKNMTSAHFNRPNLAP